MGRPVYLSSSLLGRAALLALASVMWLVSMAPGSAAAQGRRDTIFTVPQVPVFATAETASEAQVQAQREGRAEAMDLLLRRLTAEDDWVYLPRLAEGEPAPADTGDVAPPPADPMVDELFDLGMADEVGLGQETPTFDRKRAIRISAAELAELEEGFAVFEEKTSRNTYRARITFRFKPDAVRAILEGAGLPYSEAQARRALVLPVLETANGRYLWQTDNPWARAWLARPLVNELTPLILPLGDTQDVRTVNVDDVMAYDAETMAGLAARYRTKQVLVAHALLRQGNNGQFRVRVQLVDAFLAGRGDATAARAATAAARYDDDAGFGALPDDPDTIGTVGDNLADVTLEGPTNDFPALALEAVNAVVSKYGEGWKEKTLIDHAAVRALRLTAWFGNLEEWAAIRQALEGTPLVRTMDIGAFNNENAVIDLVVIGEQDQFVLAMRQENLTVWRDEDGAWNIAGFGRAERVKRLGTKVSVDEIVATGGDFPSSGDRLLGSGEDVPALPNDLFGDDASAPLILDSSIDFPAAAPDEGEGDAATIPDGRRN